MIISKSCIYALRSSVYLAAQDEDGFTTIRELSDELGISFHFLTKVLQELTKQEILKSYKGPNGGVKLAKNANDITFLDIVQAVDGNEVLTECALGLRGCGERGPCPFHEDWAGIRTSLEEIMGTVTITKLTERRITRPHSNKQGNPMDTENF